MSAPGSGGDDLFDEARAPGSRWTRVNIGEAIPGVPTPLTWSVWRPAMEHAFWWTQRQLGVTGRREAVPEVTSIALGHPAVSVDVSLDQIGRLPGYDAAAFAEQYFGFSPDDDGAPVGRRRADQARTVARVAARAPVALARLRRLSTSNAAASERFWSANVHGGTPTDPLGLLEDAAARFVGSMAVHTLEGIVCQGAYERAAAMAGDDATDVLALGGDLAEARLADDLRALAAGTSDLGAFLRAHGYHGPDEGELARSSWREDSTPVALAVRGLREGAGPTAASTAHDDRRLAERALLAGFGPLRRPGARALFSATRWLVTHRELGKAAFLRHLDVARFAARHLGEDALWCTLDELRTGRPGSREVEQRRARRDELRALVLPSSWVGDPQPIGAPVADGPLAGIGASPGIVTGRARVVLDPADLVDPIGPDEVLVARTTDPSWVTLFLTAGALVIDVGGALSHGAIIARELGVPCVIGTGDGTRRLRDGDLLAVDGTAGTVRVVQA